MVDTPSTAVNQTNNVSTNLKYNCKKDEKTCWTVHIFKKRKEETIFFYPYRHALFCLDTEVPSHQTLPATRSSILSAERIWQQCSGSGSESGSGSTGSIRFWASRIRIPLSSSKNSKKILDSYMVLWLFWIFFIFEKWCKCTPSKSNKQKNFFLKSVFVGVLKVNDENSRIRIH